MCLEVAAELGWNPCFAFCTANNLYTFCREGRHFSVELSAEQWSAALPEFLFVMAKNGKKG